MSFSKNTKTEILQNLNNSPCCRLSFLSSLLKTNAEYHISKDGFVIEIKTQLDNLYTIVNEILETHYCQSALLDTEDDIWGKTMRYRIIIDGVKVKTILLDLGIAQISEDNCFEFTDGIDNNIIADDCCKKEYIKGVLIGCGSVSGVDVDNDRSVDYHLEWIFNGEQTALDFLELLSEFNIFARKVTRKKVYVVYIQKFEQITDLLVLCGANQAMLTLNDEYAKRTIKNSVNRISNCENANISKTINASVEQMRAIDTIAQTIGLDSLDNDLYDICMLRLANSEESLKELSELSELTKSAINHKLNKIIKLAKDLREN